MAASVNWVGPGEGNWNDPANWSTGALPGPDDDVVVDSSPTPTITYTEGDSRVLSLTLNGTLRLSGGSITVVQTSQIDGGLIIEPDAAFVVEGAAGSLDVNGSTQLLGGSLIARGGAKISLLGTMQQSSTGLIRAEGTDSHIAVNELASLGPLPPGPLDLEAISREASVWRGLRDDAIPLNDLREAISREASVWRGPQDDPDVLNVVREAISREASVWRGPHDDPDPLNDLTEAISREASVRRAEPEPP